MRLNLVISCSMITLKDFSNSPQPDHCPHRYTKSELSPNHHLPKHKHMYHLPTPTTPLPQRLYPPKTRRHAEGPTCLVAWQPNSHNCVIANKSLFSEKLFYLTRSIEALITTRS